MSSERLLHCILTDILEDLKHLKVEKVPDKQQQAEKPPPQDSDEELSNASKPSPSPASHCEDALPAAQVISSPTFLRRVSPYHGPISGGEKDHLLGEGFSEGQNLLARFGDCTMPVSAKLFNPYTLECILPLSDPVRCVVLWPLDALHSLAASSPQPRPLGDTLYQHLHS